MNDPFRFIHAYAWIWDKFRVPSQTERSIRDSAVLIALAQHGQEKPVIRFRRLKIPVRDYLADILPGLAYTPLQRIADLTPAAWAAKHALV